jgi:hypothetical protein
MNGQFISCDDGTRGGGLGSRAAPEYNSVYVNVNSPQEP